APVFEILGRDRFGCKRRVVRGGGECAMQLGGADGENAHQCKISAVRIRWQCRSSAAIFNKACEIVQRVVPAVSLVGNECLQQCEYAAHVVRGVIFNRPCQRHYMRKVGHLGEETADFQLGIHAGGEASIDLEKQ